MKIRYIASLLAIPFLIVACEKAQEVTKLKIEAAKETASEKMSTGAEKVVEGVKEMSATAKADAKIALEKIGEGTKATVEATKEATANVMENAATATQEAADKLKKSAAE